MPRFDYCVGGKYKAAASTVDKLLGVRDGEISSECEKAAGIASGVDRGSEENEDREKVQATN